MVGYVADLETLTEENTDFRRVLYSGPNLQLVLMSLMPGGEIGAETHEDTDQFFRIESGEGRIEIDGQSQDVKSGSGIIVPAGARHNLVGTGDQPLRIYTIYGPPHHKDQLIQVTKAEADSSDESFDGTLTQPSTAKPSRQSTDGELRSTQTGFRFQIRSAVPGDEAAMKEFFSHVTRDDLRFRFLSATNEVGSHNIKMLTHPDHEHTESFVAITEDGSMLIASGMLACDNDLDRGEVAIVTREDQKHQGVSWELLSYIARVAQTMGLNSIESIENRANHEAIELERDMGFIAKEYPGDATLTLLTRTMNGAQAHV